MGLHRHIVRRILVIIILAGVLAACRKEPDPLPTAVNLADLSATLGIPPQEAVDSTQTARAPSITPTFFTLTPSPITEIPPTATLTETVTPTITPNPIQLTETAVYQRQTEIASTADALPPPSATSPATLTPIPSATTNPTITPTSGPILPDNPTPNSIVFSSNRGGQEDIWVMPLSGEPAQLLANLASSNEYVPACSPQGTGLIFDSTLGGDREIYLTDYLGLTFRPLTDTTGENFNPMWSPLGDTIAFVSTRTGNSDIWLMDNGGGNVRQITLSIADDIFPSWSADGNVLFYSSNRNGNFDIFQFNLSTSTESQITFTPDVDELYPVLSPDFTQIAYVAETQRGNPNTGAIFTLDQNNQVKPVIAAEGRVEMPHWISPTRLLVSAQINNQTQILVVDLSTTQSVVLTNLGQANRWPTYCYVEPSIFSQLAPAPDLPTPDQSAALVPTALPTSVIPASPYQVAPTVPENWLSSRETWTGDEFAFIAPAGLPTVTGFLIDNLLNLTWQDGTGGHVMTLALEAVDGEFTSTLIGYTVNDLPGPIREIAGLEEQIRLQILKNSVRPGLYHTDSVEFTGVNITLNFRLPIQVPRDGESQFSVVETAGSNWIISTERWLPAELALLIEESGHPASVSFANNQLLYIWQADDGEHQLLLRPAVQDNDLVLVPVAYTIDSQNSDPSNQSDFIALIREGLLLNSIAAGEFLLSQASFNSGELELIFLIPPQR